ncbi:GPI transamidase component Gpi16 subunit family protein [Forsythia ovata]|uniref:GPI transamidase component Gpi16 subunit family protein n=1 Tax=Forsythia ovata TaxID=205694 RepID=A0ABD1X921_9LAMI
MNIGGDLTPYQAAMQSLLELNYGLILMPPIIRLMTPGKNLTHALSGLFCTSINFLEHSTTYSAPQWSFRSVAGKLRYGTLPREAVCTENLTPWLKLLPCRDKAGLSALLDRPSIYRGYYHSQRLHLTSDEYDSSEFSTGVVLEQTLTVVIQPKTLGTSTMFSGVSLQPSWSLSSLFGRKVSGRCSLSKSSNVYVQLDQNLVSELKEVWKKIEEPENDVLVHEDSWNYPIFELSASPDRIINGVELQRDCSLILYEFVAENFNKSTPFDLGLRWKLPVVWSCQQAPLSASRFLMGSRNERGAIAISLKSTRSNNTQSTGQGEKGCWLRVDLFQVVPWYISLLSYNKSVHRWRTSAYNG